jgi:hypothetical protein
MSFALEVIDGRRHWTGRQGERNCSEKNKAAN